MVVFPHELLPKNHIQLVGCIAIDGAQLDLLIGLTLAKATGKTNDIAENTDFAMDTRRKVKMLTDLDDLNQDVRQGLSEMKGILKDRNKAIHGIFAGAKNGEMVFHALRGKGGAQEIERNEQWLIDLVIRIGTVAAILAAYVDTGADH